MTIRCVVACRNANGEPDFFFCKVECSDSDYDEGAHYELAADLADDEGYEQPMLVYDEYDGPGWLFERFHWPSAGTASKER